MAEYLLALVIGFWGFFIPVEFSFYQTPNGTTASTGVIDGTCHIDIYEPGFNDLSPEFQQSLLLHEYGHCAGLDHYGSCNYNESIMGCWTLGHVTEFDRIRLMQKQGTVYRLVVGPWAHD